jgi:5-methyltetrahydrofolate--homocysteine methyltransferase
MVIDGAYGTNLVHDKCVDLLNLENPEEVGKLYKAYAEAGADVIKTNTFNNCSYESAMAGASLAHIHAPKKLIAGVIGPGMIPLSKINDSKVYDSYKTAVDGLTDAGVDIILLETFYDVLNIDAAIEAVDNIKPIWLTVCDYDLDGYLDSGESIIDIFKTYASRIVVGGMNCVFSDFFLKELIDLQLFPVIGSPNTAPEQPIDVCKEIFYERVKNLKSIGISHIGGCCGTTPDFIKIIKEL